VKEVNKPVPAEIDDEMAKKYGAEDLAALKGQITERLQAEYAGAARAVMKRKLLDQLDEKVSFELPPALVDAEAAQIAHQLWHEENPEVEGHDHPEIEPTDEHKKLAERRVKLGLLLAELGQKNEIKVSDAEMSQAIMAQARQYPGQERAVLRVRAEERRRAAADPRAAVRGQGRRFRFRDVRDHRQGGLQGRPEGRRGRARGRVTNILKGKGGPAGPCGRGVARP
jgi:FKBP-type peptidyl-prolyl cis-trans isomerase (trigger factor)